MRVAATVPQRVVVMTMVAVLRVAEVEVVERVTVKCSTATVRTARCPRSTERWLRCT
jgi:hypothetical protein